MGNLRMATWGGKDPSSMPERMPVFDDAGQSPEDRAMPQDFSVNVTLQRLGCRVLRVVGPPRPRRLRGPAFLLVHAPQQRAKL